MKTLNDFLTSSYENGRKVSDCDPCLVLVKDLATLKSKPIKATEPPVDNFTSAFLGMDLLEIAELLESNVEDPGVLCDWLFAVLDERSKSDRSVLLVESADGDVETVRVGFETANLQLVAWGVGVTSAGELQSLAEENEDGVHRLIASEEEDMRVDQDSSEEADDTE